MFDIIRVESLSSILEHLSLTFVTAKRTESGAVDRPCIGSIRCEPDLTLCSCRCQLLGLLFGRFENQCPSCNSQHVWMVLNAGPPPLWLVPLISCDFRVEIALWYFHTLGSKLFEGRKKKEALEEKSEHVGKRREAKKKLKHFSYGAI